ncbi:MAG: lipopolysaccharide biosynthesis protein, partial [Anaeroplasmataceae bacterium]
EEQFGVVLTIVSMISIVAGSIGTSINNARMVYINEGKTNNGDYNLLILITGSIGILITCVFLVINHIFTLSNVIFVNILLIVTAFRYYADVEYRKNLKYGYFMLYYVLIGVGYGVGALLYFIVPVWEICFFVGEVLALILVFIKGNIFKDFFKTSSLRSPLYQIALSFMIGELINNVILNIDRLLLNYFMSGSDVTTYYVASLVGKIVALVTVPLTGVIMGYLRRFKGEFKKKYVLIYMASCLGLAFLAFIGCEIFSPILIKLLYPSVYDAAHEILLYAILAQIIFFSANLMLILIIKYKKPVVQLVINILHLVVVLALCIIGIKLKGLRGFAFSLLCGNIFKLIVIIIILLFSRKLCNYEEYGIKETNYDKD